MTRASFAIAALVVLHARTVASCDPVSRDTALEVRSAMSPFFIPHTVSNLDVVLKSLRGAVDGGKNVGFMLTSGGKEVARGVCTLISDGQVPGAIGFGPAVRCAFPGMEVGTYALSLSADRSCEANSYYATDVAVEIIEPAHLSSVSPASGPEKDETTITISGTNIGGPHVTCEYTFEAGEGAKLNGSGDPLGCAMGRAAYPAKSFTKTSVSCHTPSWPGPMQQCGGPNGCHPLDGAVCSRKVRIAVSNEAKVHSPEPIYFTYDKSATLVV